MKTYLLLLTICVGNQAFGASFKDGFGSGIDPLTGHRVGRGVLVYSNCMEFGCARRPVASARLPVYLRVADVMASVEAESPDKAFRGTGQARQSMDVSQALGFTRSVLVEATARDGLLPIEQNLGEPNAQQAVGALQGAANRLFEGLREDTPEAVLRWRHQEQLNSATVVEVIPRTAMGGGSVYRVSQGTVRLIHTPFPDALDRRAVTHFSFILTEPEQPWRLIRSEVTLEAQGKPRAVLGLASARDWYLSVARKWDVDGRQVEPVELVMKRAPRVFLHVIAEAARMIEPVLIRLVARR